ncbi:hypothetical protein SMNI109538_22240 [Smaragdicoccus niigatensis]
MTLAAVIETGRIRPIGDIDHVQTPFETLRTKLDLQIYSF